jgi:hypothetical protein
VEWAPTLGLRLDLALDGLGALYGLLATWVGLAVFAVPQLQPRLSRDLDLLVIGTAEVSRDSRRSVGGRVPHADHLKR